MAIQIGGSGPKLPYRPWPRIRGAPSTLTPAGVDLARAAARAQSSVEPSCGVGALAHADARHVRGGRAPGRRSLRRRERTWPRLTTTLARPCARSTAPSRGRSDAPKVSARGRFVAFSTPSPDFAGATTRHGRGVYVRDVRRGRTLAIMRGATGPRRNWMPEDSWWLLSETASSSQPGELARDRPISVSPVPPLLMGDGGADAIDNAACLRPQQLSAATPARTRRRGVVRGPHPSVRQARRGCRPHRRGRPSRLGRRQRPPREIRKHVVALLDDSAGRRASRCGVRRRPRRVAQSEGWTDGRSSGPAPSRKLSTRSTGHPVRRRARVARQARAPATAVDVCRLRRRHRGRPQWCRHAGADG